MSRYQVSPRLDTVCTKVTAVFVSYIDDGIVLLYLNV